MRACFPVEAPWGKHSQRGESAILLNPAKLGPFAPNTALGSACIAFFLGSIKRRLFNGCGFMHS